MTTARNHVLPLSNAVLIIRYVQLAVAVAIMGLAAYGITYFSFDGIDLTLFSALATIIISIYVIVATMSAPVIYNYWAILGLDIFAIIFWVISFSLLASEVASYTITTYSYSYCYYGYCIKNKRDGDIAKRSTDVYTYRNAMAAASGLGGLEFILFVVTLVFTSIYLHRHRKAGGHCVQQSPEAVLAPPMQQQEQPVYVQPTQTVPAPVYQQQQPVQQQQYQQQPVQPQQYQQQPVQQQQQVYQQQPQQVYQA